MKFDVNIRRELSFFDQRFALGNVSLQVSDIPAIGTVDGLIEDPLFKPP